jgi:hypothetical protein
MAIKLKKLTSFLGAVERQANPFDGGKTAQNVQGRINAPSVFQQATHNGLTNIAGGAVKFIPQFAANYANTFANLGRKAAGAPQQTIQQNLADPVSSHIVKLSGATGTGKQLAGDVAQVGLSALPGVGKGASLALKTGAGAGIGAGFGAASSFGDGGNIQDIGKSAVIGGALGGAIPVVGDALSKVKLKVKPTTPPPKSARGSVTIPKSQVKLTANPLPSKVTAADKVFRSTTGVLDKIDPRLGAMVRQRREMGESAAALVKSGLKTTNSLSKQEGTNLARVLKGTEKPLNDKVAQAATESRKALDGIYHRAKAAGIQVPGYRKNYFPQIHNPKTFQPGTKYYSDAVDHLVNSKQAKTPAEAINLLKMQRESKVLSPYGNLSKRRTVDLPGYAENVNALHRYIDRSYGSIAHAKVMGVDDAKLNRVLANVRKNGGDYNAAIKSYKQASGLTRGSDAGENASRIATNIQGSTKLGLSSIGNLTQSSNTAIAGGVGRTAKAVVKQFSKDNKDFVKSTGVTDEQVSHEALFGEEGVSGKIRNFTAPGFEQIEKSNRAVAAITGRDQALALAKKAAAGDQKAANDLFDNFGISEYKKDGSLTKENQIKAARVMVERTQFRTGPEDIPGWANTPLGKVATQFKRYPYKQAQFLKREVIDPARGGNLAPAARLAAVGAPIALGANYANDKIRGTNFQESTPEKVLDTLNTATGSNLATSIPNSLYPNSADANGYIAKVGKALGGPTASDAINATEAGFNAVKGKFTDAGRVALNHVPIVGSAISNRALPYKNSGSGGSSTSQTKTTQDANTMLSTFKDTSSKNKGYALQDLGDGRYAYTLDNGKTQTTTSIDTARKAIAKSSFAASDAEDKVIGGTYYYKDKDGGVHSQSKIQHDYNIASSQNNLAMDVAYRASDLTAWTDAAQKQYDALEAKKKLYNPDTEQDKIANITNQQNDLLYKLKTYQKKGINGSGGSSSTVFDNPYKYQVTAPSAKIRAASINLSAGTSGGVKKYQVKSIKPVKSKVKAK